MKTIDLANWPRRSHFEFFKTFQQPFVDICVKVDVTGLVQEARAREESLFGHLLHAVMGAVNAVPELRRRFHDDVVVEHERVHPSFTIMSADEVFNFCVADYLEDRAAFLEEIVRRREAMQGKLQLHLDDDVRDDLVYCTSLPWLDFQAIGHAMEGDATDCVPRVAWGKIVEEGERARVSVQLSAHHALVDGLHASRFFLALEERCRG